MLNDVSLEILQKCLNNCIHCSSNSCFESKAILEFKVIKEIIDDIVCLGAKRLCLSGGEPFLHPDITNIVEYATRKGLILDIYSSGIMGDNNQTVSLDEMMLINCKKAGLNRIMFNVQAASSEVYDAVMMTAGNFGKLVESIKRTEACGIETEIHFVPMKQNYDEIESVVKLAEELNVGNVSFLRLVPHGRAEQYKDKIMLNDQELEIVQNKLYKMKAAGKKIRIGLPLTYPSEEANCHAVKEKLYIKFDGSVFGCEAFKYIQFHGINGEKIGPDNVLENRICQVHKNSLFLKKSLELVERYSGDIADCGNCPVQKFLKGENKDV